ncbi:cell wall metabolism sensor histidine kinase WalK [Rummeliibacillus sp. SL167]|uniref:sensor histidine kinase n=1 Tax=Rummeliibacillus sp. SL167 TaxID=2579792 RepID=UPI001645ECBE|nr:HAMP domain-containing sensor histidine kinase [Rummeliibacillus sp. SL167]
MFKQIQRKLTIQYAAFFVLFVLILMIILYIAIQTIMQQQQVQELKMFYTKEQYHLMGDNIERNQDQEIESDQTDPHEKELHDHTTNKEKEIEYDTNRVYFYYVFTKKHELVHADESLIGLQKDIDRLMLQAKDGEPQSVKWKQEHLLLIKYHAKSDKNGNYIIVGQSITKQHRLLERMMYAFVVLTVIGTLFITVLSHYLAGKAMVPIRRSFERQRKFVSDASHELRTPLTVFYSSLEVLESDEENHFSSFGQEVLDDLKEETQHMKSLLEGLLFLARYDQKKLKTKKETIELSKIVNNIAKSFKRTLPATITLKLEIEEGILFEGDETSIRELLYILLDNAAKFTEQGYIKIALSKLKEKIELVVEDTGIGISDKDLPNVFERFYQATKNRQKKGTGLGLAIAQAIVFQHHGQISVESQLQKGTKFTIFLPTVDHKG